MLEGRFTARDFNSSCLDVVGKLTTATIQLWKMVKSKMRPTPSKFHYVFNLRNLSRIFQGILLAPTESIIHAGTRENFSSDQMLLALWRHECDRVFSDILSSDKDKCSYEKIMNFVGIVVYGDELYRKACSEPKFMVSFLRDDIVDDDGILIQEAPKIYEDGGTIENMRARACYFLAKYNEAYPSKRMDLVLFDDALKHLLRISRLIETPRGCGLLVGVGGSRKQSLTRLAAFIS
jgi:dynein heavy chain